MFISCFSANVIYVSDDIRLLFPISPLLFVTSKRLLVRQAFQYRDVIVLRQLNNSSILIKFGFLLTLVFLYFVLS